jgi:hypothetical protein
VPATEFAVKTGSDVTATTVPFGTNVPFELMSVTFIVVATLPLANKDGGLTKTLELFGRLPVPGAKGTLKDEVKKFSSRFPETSAISCVKRTV